MVGLALRRLPEWLLRESDRWGKPWNFLLGVRDMPKGFRVLFRAACSQRYALRRLAEIARGGGSIKTSWSQVMREALQRGELKTTRHAQEKVFASMWRYDRGRFLLAAAKDQPEIEARIRREGAKLYAKGCRKLGRTKADKENRPVIFDTRDITHKVAEKLAWGWLRNGTGGGPGFCFFSDNALLDVLRVLLRLPELPFATVRKTRERLGLRKAEILITAARKNDQALWEFLERQGNVIARETKANTSTKVVRRPNERR